MRAADQQRADPGGCRADQAASLLAGDHDQVLSDDEDGVRTAASSHLASCDTGATMRPHRQARRRRQPLGGSCRSNHTSRPDDGAMHLPVMPPVKPMLAKSVPDVPVGDYLYEPKWDGF